MEWLNIRLSQLRAPEYLRSEPVERATWLQLLAYCADQENGGRILGCGPWKDRTWQQVAGVMLREVQGLHHLWQWEGDELVVWGYPVEKESIVRSKREAARSGGKASGISRRQSEREPSAQANGEAYASPNGAAHREADSERVLERKGIGKGKEEERNSTTTTTTAGGPPPAQALDHPHPPPLNRGCTLDEAFAFADRFNASSLAGYQIPRPTVTLWHDDRTASGWVKVRDGHEMPIADWQADLRAYAQRYANNERTRPIRPPAEPRPGSHPKAHREPDTVHTAASLPRI